VQIKKGRTFIFQNTVILEKAEQDTVIYAVLPIARMTDKWGVSTSLPQGVTKLAPVNSPPAVGGEVELAAPIERVRMPYPAEARSQGIEGQVAIFARINVDGTLSDAIVLSSPHEILTKAVLDSLAKARYRPMRLNGHPVACGIDLLVEFKLTEAAGLVN
jgi:TonB family protein